MMGMSDLFSATTIGITSGPPRPNKRDSRGERRLRQELRRSRSQMKSVWATEGHSFSLWKAAVMDRRVAEPASMTAMTDSQSFKGLRVFCHLRMGVHQNKYDQ